MKRFWIVLMLVTSAVGAVASQEGTLPPEQEARYRTLIHELRCLVCQNQTIADSDADLAADLRKQVHDRISSGESDADIRRYVTDRYGDFVLYKPALSPRTVLLWTGPFLILAGALVIALRILRRRPKSVAPPQAVDPLRLRKLLDEEKL